MRCSAAPFDRRRLGSGAWFVDALGYALGVLRGWRWKRVEVLRGFCAAHRDDANDCFARGWM